MSIKIETPEGQDALTEFVLFHDKVYEYRSARWPALVPMQLPILTGESAFAEGRTLRPFAARAGGDIVARVVAVIDEHYQHHWNEKLGHLVMFEAMPDTREAVKQLADAACEWLRARGAIAARAGFGLLEFPFAIDDYETLPPNILRQNPAYFHSLIKDAGFESEQGWVDYRIKVTPELTARWESALEGARRAGFQIVPLRDIPLPKAAEQFTPAWNEAFDRHWGATPFTRNEVEQLFSFFALSGGLDTSVIAYRGDEVVGTLMVTPEGSEGAILAPGRKLNDWEKVNFLGIGVRQTARGRGVNLAMSAYAFLELIKRGQKYMSYTLVLDHNWPSRRTAEKLGATVCSNYMVYRRNFSRQ